MKFLKKYLPYISLMVSIITALFFSITLFFDSSTNRDDGIRSIISDFFKNNNLIITIIMIVYVSTLVIFVFFKFIKYLNLVEEEKRLKSYSRRLEKAMALELTEEEQEEKEKEKVKEKENKEENVKSQDTKKRN